MESHIHVCIRMITEIKCMLSQLNLITRAFQRGA